MLLSVLLLYVFWMIVSALFELEVYGGTFLQKCVLAPPANITWHQYHRHIKNNINWIKDPNTPDFFIMCGNATGAG